MFRVLFVCTGNTCRSPMAEAILRSKLNDTIEVKSAGVYALDGSPASIQAQEVMAQKGLTHNHRSSTLTKESIDWATHIITMTKGHKQWIISQFPIAIEKTFTLKEFVLNDKNGDITDPFGGSVDVYERTYVEMEKLINGLINKLYE